MLRRTLETLHSACCIIMLYTYFITNFGNREVLEEVQWSVVLRFDEIQISNSRLCRSVLVSCRAPCSEVRLKLLWARRLFF